MKFNIRNLVEEITGFATDAVFELNVKESEDERLLVEWSKSVDLLSKKIEELKNLRNVLLVRFHPQLFDYYF